MTFQSTYNQDDFFAHISTRGIDKSFVPSSVIQEIADHFSVKKKSVQKRMNGFGYTYSAKSKGYNFVLSNKPQVAKAKGLVPAKKATKKSGKAGRIVGISADENAYIQEVLIMIADDPELGQSNKNYVKIQARYNK